MAYTGNLPLPPGGPGAAATGDDQASVGGPASMSASPPLLEPCQVPTRRVTMRVHGCLQLCHGSCGSLGPASADSAVVMDGEHGRGCRVQPCVWLKGGYALKGVPCVDDARQP